MGGAHFLGACCWETEMLALPKVVSILAATCPVWSLLFTGFHMVPNCNTKRWRGPQDQTPCLLSRWTGFLQGC